MVQNSGMFDTSCIRFRGLEGTWKTVPNLEDIYVERFAKVAIDKGSASACQSVSEMPFTSRASPRVLCRYHIVEAMLN
jgi:hypothetical protein